jgi:hypothetical protein
MKFMKKLTALITLCLMLSSLAGGQVPNVPNAPPNKANEPMTTGNVPAGVHELTAADVEAFLDGIVPLQLEQQDVAGATIAIVKDRKLFFPKATVTLMSRRKSPPERKRLRLCKS